MSPQRIQRRRTKGWRMPEGAVYVGRGTKWGNPYKVGEKLWLEDRFTEKATAKDVTDGFRESIADGDCDTPDVEDIRAEIAGKDLACWCPLDQPCHADVLLEIANA